MSSRSHNVRTVRRSTSRSRGGSQSRSPTRLLSKKRGECDSRTAVATPISAFVGAPPEPRTSYSSFFASLYTSSFGLLFYIFSSLVCVLSSSSVFSSTGPFRPSNPSAGLFSRGSLQPFAPPCSSIPSSSRRSSVDWLAVSAARSAARSSAECRSARLSSSRAAYAAGDKASASLLSEEGRAHGERMERENARAKDLIFGGQDWRGERTVDLHGLFVSEASEAVAEVLDHFSSLSAPVDCTIVTGAGHHSAGNKAVLRPMVEQELRRRGLAFESLHGDGAFHVVFGSGNLHCGECSRSIFLQLPGTWGGEGEGWSCNSCNAFFPMENGHNCPLYGCRDIQSCDWGICQKCYVQTAGSSDRASHVILGSGNLSCGECSRSIVLQLPGTWGAEGEGWTCDVCNGFFPMENGRDCPLYGCRDIQNCDWGVCQKCYVVKTAGPSSRNRSRG